MNNHYLFILAGLLLVFSCEQRPTADNSAIELQVEEQQTVDSIPKLSDVLVFNLTDTLSKYKKPVLFYMWTDWCGNGCESVDEATISREKFRDLVDMNFQFYKIDGDLPYQFRLNDSVYEKKERMNDFMYAFYEPSEMASYPSFMIINEKGQVKTVIPPQFKAKYSDMVDYFVSLSE